MVKDVVKQLDVVGGKWVKTEKHLNDDSDEALPLSLIILESPDQNKRMKLTLDNDGVVKLTDESGNQHRLLLTGVNSQSGTVVFENSKSMRIDFPTEFTNWPAITVTLGDVNASPPYRVYPGKTGFTVRFQNSYTGEVQWVAMEA